MGKGYKNWLAAVCACTAIGLSAQTQAAGDYLLATASTGGTFYPV